jgi:hypothetical protein
MAAPPARLAEIELPCHRTEQARRIGDRRSDGRHREALFREPDCRREKITPRQAAVAAMPPRTAPPPCPAPRPRAADLDPAPLRGLAIGTDEEVLGRASGAFSRPSKACTSLRRASRYISTAAGPEDCGSTSPEHQLGGNRRTIALPPPQHFDRGGRASGLAVTTMSRGVFFGAAGRTGNSSRAMASRDRARSWTETGRRRRELRPQPGRFTRFRRRNRCHGRIDTWAVRVWNST